VLQSTLIMTTSTDLPVAATDRLMLPMDAQAFAALVRHELLNPVNALAGWLHLLEARPAVSPQIVDRAVSGARRALDLQIEQIRLLGEVLCLLAPAAHAPQGVQHPVECVAVSDLLAAHAGSLPGHVDALPGDSSGVSAPGLTVRANRQALDAALRSLIRHAVHHDVPGSRLRLSAHAADKGVWIVLAFEGEVPRLAWSAFDPASGHGSLELLHARLAVLAQGGRFDDAAACSDGRLLIWLPAA
jgi:signal transduction histidine kinase